MRIFYWIISHILWLIPSNDEQREKWSKFIYKAAQNDIFFK